MSEYLKRVRTSPALEGITWVTVACGVYGIICFIQHLIYGDSSYLLNLKLTISVAIMLWILLCVYYIKDDKNVGQIATVIVWLLCVFIIRKYILV